MAADNKRPSTVPLALPTMGVRYARLVEERSKAIRDAVHGALDGEGDRLSLVWVDDFTLLGIAEDDVKVSIVQAVGVGNRISVEEIRLNTKAQLSAIREACDRLLSVIEAAEAAAADDD